MTKVAALAVADLHLWHRPPVARSTEKDWYAAMQRPLDDLERLQRKHRCPVLYCGDLTDRPSAPPELINFMLDHLPHGYAIWGNHDLAHHQPADLGKTAFGTLVRAGKIKLLDPGYPLEISTKEAPCPLRLHSFPFGVDPKPLKKPLDLFLEIALVHRYVWIPGKGHPGAKDDATLRSLKRMTRGYDVVVIGDNHQGWLVDCREKGLPVYLNVGGLLRRKNDERSYRPCVGLIYVDGSVKRHFLDCSQDKFLDASEAAPCKDYSGFLAELQSLGEAGTDFAEAMTRALRDNKDGEVRRIILEAMGE